MWILRCGTVGSVLVAPADVNVAMIKMAPFTACLVHAGTGRWIELNHVKVPVFSQFKHTKPPFRMVHSNT